MHTLSILLFFESSNMRRSQYHRTCYMNTSQESFLLPFFQFLVVHPISNLKPSYLLFLLLSTYWRGQVAALCSLEEYKYISCVGLVTNVQNYFFLFGDRSYSLQPLSIFLRPPQSWISGFIPNLSSTVRSSYLERCCFINVQTVV